MLKSQNTIYSFNNLHDPIGKHKNTKFKLQLQKNNKKPRVNKQKSSQPNKKAAAKVKSNLMQQKKGQIVNYNTTSASKDSKIARPFNKVKEQGHQANKR